MYRVELGKDWRDVQYRAPAFDECAWTTFEIGVKLWTREEETG